MHDLTFQEVQGLMERHGSGDLEWANSYGEPGYSLDEDKRAIIFGNWNPIPSFICNALEKQFELEWSDEWLVDHNDEGKAYRCQPDNHGWKAFYIITEDGEVWGGEAIEADPEEYVNEYLLNSTRHVCTFNIDLAGMGFELMPEVYETGFHPFQTDEPNKILAAMQEKYPHSDFVFGKLKMEQFAAKYQLYRRPDKEKDAQAEFKHAEGKLEKLTDDLEEAEEELKTLTSNIFYSTGTNEQRRASRTFDLEHEELEDRIENLKKEVSKAEDVADEAFAKLEDIQKTI